MVGGVRGRAAEKVLLLSGSTGSGYTVEDSNDLQTWVIVKTVDNLTGALQVKYSELGDYAYYRVSHAGSSELRAIGLAVYEEVKDANRLEQIKLMARDRALEAIAGDETRLTQEQINSLFSKFATQEAFNAGFQAVDSNAAAIVSRDSVERIVGILSGSGANVTAADLDSIRAVALSTGLTGGIVSGGGSSADATAAVAVAVQTLSSAVQQSAAQTAQTAALAAIAAQLTGANAQELLTAINDAVAALRSGSGSPGGPGTSVGNGGGISSGATAVLGMLGSSSGGLSTSTASAANGAASVSVSVKL